jgi:hypothetical protein
MADMAQETPEQRLVRLIMEQGGGTQGQQGLAEALMAPPRNPGMGASQTFMGMVAPHLADPETYRPLPPPSMEPNAAGKVPEVAADPRMQGAAADVGSLLGAAIPFGGPVAGGAKLAVPALAAALKAARAAPRAAEIAAMDFAKFPQYAERYPEVGPPAWAVDKKTGKEYLAKQPTPEAEAFMAERVKISKDMEKNGFDPYFDPSKRTHVDPTNYPPNVDTTQIVPAKQSTIDKHMANIGSEESRSRLRSAFERGSAMPDTADWYAMAQLEEAFIKELGPVEGRKAFQDKIATSMAATTGGADPTSNLMMAQYGNYLREHGLPYPTAAYEMPVPIGGRYATGNMEMHKKIFDQGGFSALGETNPKRHNFSQDFTGNRNAATMDEQMTSGMTPGINMPPPGQYGLYEQVLADEAKKVGVPPQNYQDVAWAGFKNEKDPKYVKGEPFIQTINRSIERTHRLTGMPKDEIVRRGLIRSEIPVYGVTGLAGTGTLAEILADQARRAVEQ